MNTINTSPQKGPEYRSIRMQSNATVAPMSFSNTVTSVTPVKAASLPKQPLHKQWEVPEKLPAVPSDYLIGKSNVTVKGASPQEIASRIYKGLGAHSIAAVPSDSHMNSITAEATCGLKFTVNLYQDPVDSSSTLVEVVRRTGCSYWFSRCSRDILRVAKGDSCKPSLKFPKVLSIPKGIPKACCEDREKIIEADTQHALDLVESSRTDAQLLGLQSLERLSTNETAARILHNEKNIGIVQSFLVLETSDAVMKRRALGVLANVIRLSPPDKKCDKLKCQVFLGSLFQPLIDSVTSPHEALVASQCLEHSLEALSENKREDLAKILSNFASNHFKLVEQSKSLQNKLNGQ